MGRLIVNIVGAKGYKKEVLRKERYQGDRWYIANIPITKALPKGFQVIMIYIAQLNIWFCVVV